jgi:quercetin dioxygenase-like cupin family protein
MKALPQIAAASLAALAAPLAAHDGHVDAYEMPEPDAMEAAADRIDDDPAEAMSAEEGIALAMLPSLPPGSNLVLRSPLSLADGLEVIVSDVVIPPGATVPRHYHPGEEFLYLVEGTATHVQEGQADIELTAGAGYVIPARAIHAPRGGPQGARAIVFRVHVEGQEERVLVPEE